MFYEDTLANESVELKEKSNIYFIVKRIFDVILSFLALIVLWPVFLILSLLIKLDSEGPVIYKHKRLGKNGSEFYLYKFRTMVTNSEEVFKNFTPEQKREYEMFFKLENDPRITRVGNFLRKTSLDELPQLINILKGDMSIIGPRPVVLKEIEKFDTQKDKYLSILPGITGWWACNGRSDTTYEDRIKLEMYYINNVSFKLDIQCFFKTIIAVLKKSGAR